MVSGITLAVWCAIYLQMVIGLFFVVVCGIIAKQLYGGRLLGKTVALSYPQRKYVIGYVVLKRLISRCKADAMRSAGYRH